MTANKCIQKLLRFKGLRVVDFAFEGASRLVILVKPHKNGCRCPNAGGDARLSGHCRRRGGGGTSR